MPNIVKPLKIAIDLKSLTNKKIKKEDKNLLKNGSLNGALGSISVLAETFDLYLITKYKNITQDEIVRWLKAADIDKCFRKIIIVGDDVNTLKELILQNGINVTIVTDIEIINTVENSSEVYWLSEVHTKDIRNGIQKVNSWYEVLKDVIKYSTAENYDFKYNKKKRK